MVTVKELFSTPFLLSSSCTSQLTVSIQLVSHRNRTRCSSVLSAKQNVQQQKGWLQIKTSNKKAILDALPKNLKQDPYVLDENISVEFSSPSSSSHKSFKDLGSPEEAANKVLKQYLTEFMLTRLGVRRESNVVATSSRVADDGRLYYQVEVNIKSYASNNELAVMPQDLVVRLECDRRYLSVLGVENSRLYELRLQTPENVFIEEEGELQRIMESFRVNTVTA